ncbi:MAG: hypothetical protein GXO19_01110 [Epsilonproteobacteria bacterium]|nr:hypothetical protein [Campylobacterota bacterium]
MRLRYRVVSALLLAVVLGGCGDSGSSRPEVSDKNLVFDLKRGAIPFPNDLFYLPTPQEPGDGTLNIPYDPKAPSAPILKEINRLDGFSTTSPIFIGTNALVDPTSTVGHIHIYEVNGSGEGVPPIPEEVVGEFRDFKVVTQEEKILLIPTRPLKGGTHYIVAIDRGLYTIDGEPITPDEQWRYLLGEGVGDLDLDRIKPLYQKMLAVTHRSLKDTIAIWSFTTQTIGERAEKIVNTDYSRAKMVLQDTGFSSKEVLAQLGIDTPQPPNDRLYTGLLTGVPYFPALPTRRDPLAPLNSPADWEHPNQVAIPVLASVPTQCEMPSSGWPTVIFIHGITQNRTNLLALSQTFGKICYAAVAIDLPLHGITDPQNPLYMGNYERTFNLDLWDSLSNGFGQDGVIDESGKWYINLQNPAISRDNILQSSADIEALRSTFGKIVSLDGVKFDPERIYYVGHSLGAMVPYPYLKYRDFNAVLLANPGGGIAQLLNNSESFGPIIAEALAKGGLKKGTPEYDRYMVLTQTLIDDADPINYGKYLKGERILTYEVLGDSVIPNRVLSAPLSGTEPLLKEMEAENILNAPSPLERRPYFSRFVYGDHSSLLKPIYPAITAEMHLQMASYLASDGRQVKIGDPSLME